MRKIIFPVLFLVVSFFLFPLSKPALAADCTGDYNPKDLYEDSRVFISVSNTKKGHDYLLKIHEAGFNGKLLYSDLQKITQDNQVYTWDTLLSDIPIKPGNYDLTVSDDSEKFAPYYCLNARGVEVKANQQNCPNYSGNTGGTNESDPVILNFDHPPRIGIDVVVDGKTEKTFPMTRDTNKVNIGSYSAGSHSFEVFQVKEDSTRSLCYSKKYFTVTKGTCTANVSRKEFNPNETGVLMVTGSGIEAGKPYSFDFQGCETKCTTTGVLSPFINYQFNINNLKCSQGYHEVVVHSINGSLPSFNTCPPSPLSGPSLCSTPFWTNEPYSENTPTPNAPPPPCAKLENGKCTEVDTGLGIPIKTKPADFIKSIFGILLGLSGGIALLLIIASGYRLMASQGNPEKLQGAREMLTSAIVGLLFIIFSFVILQVIGVDILKIPGFNP